MLIVSETRYVPTAVNMMVLQGKDGLFYYMHRSLYDQCVILRDQYMRMLPSFYKMFGLEDKHPAVCDAFMERVPEPADILGPFLSLVEGCEELDNIEDMCGAITAMSMSVDFRKMFRVPAEVRRSIKFSLNVKEEYRIQWDRFFLETPEFDQVNFSRTTAPAAEQYTAPSTATEDEDGSSYEFVGGELDMDALLADMESSLSSGTNSGGAGGSEKEGDAPAPTGAQSGFALLRGLK